MKKLTNPHIKTKDKYLKEILKIKKQGVTTQSCTHAVVN